MKKHAVSRRKIIIGVVIATVAVGMCVLAWLLVEPDDGLVPILATVRVSRVVVEPITAIKVDKTTEVHDQVLGADVRGTCHTTGTVSITLTPNPTKAAFELSLVGESVSDTVGTHGPAQITSRAATKYKALKEVLFDGHRFTTTPATVTTDTNLTIENVSSTEPGLRGRIVEKVADRRVRRQYEESRKIAAQRVVSQVSKHFDAAVQEHLDELNHKLQLRQLLNDQVKGHENLPLRLKTTKKCLHVSFLAEQGEPRKLPEFSLQPSSAVRVGLNLLALAKNPIKTMKTIRLLYKEREVQNSNRNATKDKTQLAADSDAIRAVKVGTQNGWVVIHIEEKE